jgi:hypothetical protein
VSVNADARIDRLRDWFALQIQFAEVLAAKSGIPLEVAITFHTNLHRRLGFGRPVGDRRSAPWERFLHELLALPQGPGRLACALTFARGRLLPWSSSNSAFGCFGFDPPAEGVVRIHFSPNDIDGGVGPLDRRKYAKRVAELRDMFAFIGDRHPQAQRVAGGSWLYHLDAYRRLFPDAYISSLRPNTTATTRTGGSWWGQFIDHDENVVPERVGAFTASLRHLDPAAVWRVFPMPPLTAQAPIDVFHEHYASGG